MGIELLDQERPDWLDERFLSATLGTNESIQSFSIQRAVGKGENYLSMLYRVEVILSNGTTKDLIVKAFPQGEFMQKMASEMGVFDRELTMYNEVLPSMRDLAVKRTTDNDLLAPFHPRLLPTNRPDTVVLEDLRPLGFRMANRRERMDREHILVVVKALARFHAMSVAKHQEDPESIERLGEVLYTDANKEKYEPFFKMIITDLCNEIEHWEGCEDYADRIRRIEVGFYDKIKDIVTPKKDAFNVLTHGDCWTNNILFRYGVGGELREVRFIDFQISRYTNPVLDLLYLVYSSAQNDIMLGGMDPILEEYHKNLSWYLRELHVDSIPSLGDLKVQLESSWFFSFIISLTILTIVINDGDISEKLDEMSVEDLEKCEINPMKDALQSERYRKILQPLLHFFADKGEF